MEFIDAKPVVSHRVRFQQRAEITEVQAELVKDAETVVWLVKAVCLPPQYHPIEKDSEERYRFNIQNVVAATPLAGELRDQALAFIDHGADQAFLIGRPGGFEAQLPFESGFIGEAEIAMARIRLLLDEIGELYEGESVADAVRRLLERRLPESVSIGRIAFAEAGGE